MQFRPGHKLREDPTINITPLIDVVFLLLIFFMVSTTFVVSPGIKVNLPKTESKEVARDKKEINVAVSKAGKIYLDGTQITLADLQRALAETAKADTDTLVVIQADEVVSHGTVVQVMDAAKSNGFNKLAIATETRQ